MLTSGPETDLAVAKACGYDGYMSCGVCFIKSDRTDQIFRPSIDMNDAIIAANRHELFNGAVLINFDGWMIQQLDDKREPGFVICREKNPALAICAAILKLAEESGHEMQRDFIVFR